MTLEWVGLDGAVSTVTCRKTLMTHPLVQGTLTTDKILDPTFLAQEPLTRSIRSSPECHRVERRITALRSTTDRIYDGGPIRL
jgi:hypothetical protein